MIRSQLQDDVSDLVADGESLALRRLQRVHRDDVAPLGRRGCVSGLAFTQFFFDHLGAGGRDVHRQVIAD